MIPTEYKGESFYLWVNMPNWGNGLSVELGMPSRTEAGLSDRESRRRLGNSLSVFQYQFVSLIEGDALQELRDALKSRTTERVMIPFWPAMRHPDDFASLGIEAGVNLTFDLHPDGMMNTSSFALHEGALAEGWPVSEQTCTVPLLLGHLDDLEPAILGKPDLAEVPVRFVEDSTAKESLSITPQAWQNGLDLNGTVFSVFPLTPNTASTPKAGGTKLVIERDILGQGRRTREDYHKATSYESISMDYQCATAEEWLKLLAFFTERTDWQAFWLPSPIQTTRLATQTDGSNQITVLDASWIEPGDCIALCSEGGHSVRRVHSIAGKVLTLDNPVDLLTAHDTMVTPAILGRLVKRRMKLFWSTDSVAETSLEFRELPPEAVEPAVETADSLGALPTLASLYTFTKRPSFDALLEVLQVTFVIDISGSMGPVIDATAAAISDIIREVSPVVQIQWALVSYESSPLTVKEFTAIESEITAALQSLVTGGGTERAYDAITHASNDLGWSPSAKKRLMILLTDEDNDTGSNPEANALTALQSESVSLSYGLSSYPGGGAALSESEGADFSNLAESTGGRLLANVDELRALIVGEANEGIVSHFTSYEQDLSTETLSWEAIPITHGAVKRSIDLQDECTIEAEITRCPVLLAHWRKETGTVDVAIERAEVSGQTVINRQVVFAGEVRKLTSRGTKAMVSCGIPRVFDAVLPRARFAPVCQWSLYSVPCGLVSGDWTFEARVADVGTPGYPFTFVVDSITRQNGEALPSGFGSANWFAWGGLKSDDDTVAIRQSSAVSGGSMALTLARDPNPMLTVGEIVQLRPGCDGLPETCGSKFDNFLNWGGARVAAANLSLVKVNLPGGDSGGKK
jgi:hypothetical protein